MKLVIAYLFISLFLAGVCHPTIHLVSDLADCGSFVISENQTAENPFDEPDTNKNSETEKSNEVSKSSDNLDEFFHKKSESLTHYSFFKTSYLLSVTFLVSGFSDILILPPKV